MRALKRFLGGRQPSAGTSAPGTIANESTAQYWTRHNVTAHRRFADAARSLAYLEWRNDQYFGYIDRMPVRGQDGRVVLDYGCGPGHDLVGFGVYSKPARLIAMDVSSSSMAEAKARLALHGIEADFLLLDPGARGLPLEDASVDYVHCSGVLHHVPYPGNVLQEFHRVLRPGGECRIMVYNYYSLWTHLYVAYHRRVVEGRDAEVDLLEAFARSTDGEGCPISRAYKPRDFVTLCERAGFEAECTGAAVSVFETGLAASRFDAIRDERLEAESRKFLIDLTFDDRQLALYGDYHAGIDACFRLQR